MSDGGRERGEALRGRLSPAASARLPQIEWVAQTGSTSSDLLARAASLPARAARVADAQTAGRGRRGRSWSMPAGGNLALSLFARLQRPAAQLGGLSLALGVACAERLRRAGLADVGLKWPNDLLARGRKLGGLLVELARGDALGCEAVIGLGLNLRLPVEADPGWVGLAELGAEVEPLDAAAWMLNALLPALDDFERDGFEAFAGRWPEFDALAGRAAWVEAAGERIEGQVAGVRADGALRLATASGERTFLSADVSLRPA